MCVVGPGSMDFYLTLFTHSIGELTYKYLNLDLAGEEENDIESSVIKNHGEKVFCVLRSLYKILNL